MNTFCLTVSGDLDLESFYTASDAQYPFYFETKASESVYFCVVLLESDS